MLVIKSFQELLFMLIVKNIYSAYERVWTTYQ